MKSAIYSTMEQYQGTAKNPQNRIHILKLNSIGLLIGFYM
jgi:hypothetical protein